MMKFFRLLLVSLLGLTIGWNVIAENDEHGHSEGEHEMQSAEGHNEHGDEEGHHDEIGHEEDEHDDHASGDNEDAGHESHDEHDGEEASVVKLTPEMLTMGGIKVIAIQAVDSARLSLYAPGEIVNNLYKTSVIGVQLESKVQKRHVVLGQHVKQGQLIATLFSSDMAELQQSLMLAGQEWGRVKELGKKTVGSKRYTEALLSFESANSKIQAAGMSQQAVKTLLGEPTKIRLGEYQIVAPHEGVVLEDDFQQGQYLSFGDSLITLVNEDELWVDALIAPKIGQSIPKGTVAEVIVDGKSFTASVIQENHAIDHTTRTRKIRLELPNEKHLLHAGQFAEVKLQLPIKGEVILVPESALMRSSDGDWVVFVEGEPGQFEPLEVELVNTSNGMHIVEGLKAGQRVAVEGAFFVASELAKGGFDPHNH